MGEVYKSIRLVDDSVQVLVALLFGKVGSFQQFGKASNGNNGSFELVGEVGNKAFAQSFHTTQTFYHVVEFFRNKGVFQNFVVVGNTGGKIPLAHFVQSIKVGLDGFFDLLGKPNGQNCANNDAYTK